MPLSINKTLHQFEKEFFLVLNDHISYDAFSVKKLEGLAGLSAPNNFTIEELKEPLIKRKFPGEKYTEYCWAIAESFDRTSLNRISDDYFLLYITSVYLFCDSKEPFGMELSGFYIEKCIRTFWHKSDIDGLHLCQKLLRNIDLDKNICVEYFSLLGLLFLERIIRSDSDFWKTYRRLNNIRDEFEEYEDLSYDSESQLEWYELHESLPSPDWVKPLDLSRVLFL